ncbi:hypothetical protein V6N13_048302 [Hibiscus sabdariffa]
MGLALRRLMSRNLICLGRGCKLRVYVDGMGWLGMYQLGIWEGHNMLGGSHFVVLEEEVEVDLGNKVGDDVVVPVDFSTVKGGWLHHRFKKK